MAGAARYTILVDASALRPVILRDTLIELCCEVFFALKWSEAIEEEYRENCLAAGESSAVLAERIDLMHAAIPDWKVNGDELIRPTFQVDCDSAKVVISAAVVGHADCIVSRDSERYPKEALTKLNVEILHPDDFIVLQLELNPVEALKAFKSIRKRHNLNKSNPQIFFQKLVDAGLTRTAEHLSEDSELI